MDFVFADGTTTIDGLAFSTAFGFRDDDTEVIAALGTGSGKVYSHQINLTLPVSPFKSALGPSPPAVASRCEMGV